VTPKSFVWVPGLAAPTHPNFTTYSYPRLLSNPLISGIAELGHTGDIIFLALSDKKTWNRFRVSFLRIQDVRLIKMSASAMDLFSLAGRTTVITGGTRGIGAEMAIALAEAGSDIIFIQVLDLFIPPATK
jgi:hypothetical protein